MACGGEAEVVGHADLRARGNACVADVQLLDREAVCATARAGFGSVRKPSTSAVAGADVDRLRGDVSSAISLPATQSRCADRALPVPKLSQTRKHAAADRARVHQALLCQPESVAVVRDGICKDE